MIAKNFYSIAIAITTLVMFGFWILAKTIVDNYHFLTPLIAAFTSVGVYKAAFYCLILLSRKYTYIKKLIYVFYYVKYTFFNLLIALFLA